MRFAVEVRWSEDGTLAGGVGPEGSALVPFSGVIQLVGLLERSLAAPPNHPATRRRTPAPHALAHAPERAPCTPPAERRTAR